MVDYGINGVHFLPIFPRNLVGVVSLCRYDQTGSRKILRNVLVVPLCGSASSSIWRGEDRLADVHSE